MGGPGDRSAACGLADKSPGIVWAFEKGRQASKKAELGGPIDYLFLRVRRILAQFRPNDFKSF
jgi:hypothetical protein